MFPVPQGVSTRPARVNQPRQDQGISDQSPVKSKVPKMLNHRNVKANSVVQNEHGGALRDTYALKSSSLQITSDTSLWRQTTHQITVASSPSVSMSQKTKFKLCLRWVRIGALVDASGKLVVP